MGMIKKAGEGLNHYTKVIGNFLGESLIDFPLGDLLTTEINPRSGVGLGTAAAVAVSGCLGAGYKPASYGEERPARVAYEEPEGAASPVQDNPSPLSLSLTTDVLSKYMFRGFTYSEGPVVQLVPTVTYGNLSLVGFVNYDNVFGDFNETDLTLDYTRQFEKLCLSLGYTYITFPNIEVNDTQEIYAIASLDGLLQPSLKIFHDIDDISGTYIEGTLSHDFDINGFPLSVTALLAYNDHFLREESGFSHAELKFAVPLRITDK
ncbi:unnamed protein product, partial [marine sediment metagenome]